MRLTKPEKRQLGIYVAAAYGISYILGILMWFGYAKGRDLSVFPNAQMMYPAAGVMLLLIVSRRKEEVPMRFFISYLITTALMIVCAVASLFMKEGNLAALGASQIILIVGSMIGGILMLTESKEKREACGLRGKNWKQSFLLILLFTALYLLRSLIALALEGQIKQMADIFADPFTWIMLVSILLNYVFVFIAFFGEEYGWRYYLQPLLQKRYGKRAGLFVLGVVWGLWHLPIDFFYYTTPDMGVLMVLSQIVTCITISIFFAYAYMKTENIWVPTIMHFLNNNLIVLLAGDYSADVLQNQMVTWGSLLMALVLNAVVFWGFLFAKEFRKD